MRQRDGALTLHGPVREDVVAARAALGQHLANKQAPVAVSGVRLAAEQGNAVIAGEAQDALECPAQGRVLRHRPVERVPICVVVGPIGGAPVKLLTEGETADPPRGRQTRKRLAAVLRRESR